VKVAVFGASGMVGAGAVLECLDDPRVTEVLAIVRTPTGRVHPKLREVRHGNFYEYDALLPEFATTAACFFCLGVSAAGLSEADYAHQTYDLTLAAARPEVQADGVIAGLLRGDVSPETRAILIERRNPLAPRDSMTPPPTIGSRQTLQVLRGLALGSPEFQRR
jgi:hypothetical protein